MTEQAELREALEDCNVPLVIEDAARTYLSILEGEMVVRRKPTSREEYRSLDRETVRKIYKLQWEIPMSEIADQFGVDRKKVHGICNRKHYADYTEDLVPKYARERPEFRGKHYRRSKS